MAGKITIDMEVCKGCELCATVCPEKIINFSKTKTNSRGYYPALAPDTSKCSGCAACACICPDIAITVERFLYILLTT